jgi:hypothetical protein
MLSFAARLLLAGAALALAGTAAQAQNCVGGTVFISGDVSEVEGELIVKAGKGCVFGLDGIPGSIISQKPKVGRADVQNLRPSYAAKPGYQGPDEFAYTFIGTGRYGGPMRVTIKRRVTVVP